MPNISNKRPHLKYQTATEGRLSIPAGSVQTQDNAVSLNRLSVLGSKLCLCVHLPMNRPVLLEGLVQDHSHVQDELLRRGTKQHYMLAGSKGVIYTGGEGWV